jgi:hypothetical protein
VLLDDYRERYLYLGNGAGAQAGRRELKELNAEAKRVLAIVRSAMSGLAGKLAPIKALGTLLIAMLVDEERPPDPPSIEAIKAAIEEVVSEDTARQQMAAIMTAWTWFDAEVRLLNALKAKNMQPSTVEVEQFDTHLDAILGPNSEFLLAMSRLLEDDAARKRALTAFVVGTTLYLQLQLLAIHRKGLYRVLLPADYDALGTFLDKAKAALQRTGDALDQDYLAAIGKGDLGASPEGLQFAKGFNVSTVGVDNGGDSPGKVIRGHVEDVQRARDAVTTAATEAARPAVATGQP